MALISKLQNEMLATLQEKLDAYMINHWLVMIHVNTTHMEMHHAIYPDDVLVTNSELLLSFNHFKLSVSFEEAEHFEIDYDEIDDGYYIMLDDLEIYLDFQHKDECN